MLIFKQKRKDGVTVAIGGHGTGAGGVVQVSKGTSSSEVVSSDRGMSSTSSSEEDEEDDEKEGEADRGIELAEEEEEEEGEALKSEMLRPSV